MNGREKLEAALSGEGTPEIGAVICYEGIYIRDHWSQLTRCPWWYREETDIGSQLQWRREAISRTGLDWFELPRFYSRERQHHLSIDVRPEGVFRRDSRTGEEEELPEPQVAGWTGRGELESIQPESLAMSPEEIGDAISETSEFDPGALVEEGVGDLASAQLADVGDGLFPLMHVAAPLWSTYRLWGFHGMMNMVAQRPDLVKHACQIYLDQAIHIVRSAAALGAAGIWIEDALTDLVSPKAFGELNAPFVHELADEINALGMKSIYYYCGNPIDRMDHISSIGADALSFEESKKGFTVEVEEIVRTAGDRHAILGNLDAIGVLQNGSEEDLRGEIKRQLDAGRRNGSRFVMSLGSPVTPGTSVDRVRLYCDLVRELASG